MNYPEHWIEVQVGDVVTVVSGGTPRSGNPENFEAPGKGIGWLTPADLSGYTKKYIAYGNRDLTPIGYQSSSAKIVPAGSIVFSSRAPIGYLAIAKNEISTNQGFKSFVLPSSIDSSYAYYYFKNIRDLAESFGTGTTFKEISGSAAKTLPFLLIPLAEQKVIADKLDDMLAKNERIKAYLDRIPQTLKRFRQSVLMDAVSGKLTEEWRKSDNYLFLNERLPYPTNWDVSTLGACLNYGKCNKRSPDKVSPEEWVLELEDIEKDSSKLLGKITFEERKSKSTKNEFKSGDVLYGKLRPYLNKVIIADQDGLSTTEIIPISPQNNLLSYFIFIWLKSPFFIEYVNKITYGVNMPRLGTDDGRAAPIVIPPINEQVEIIRRVETLFSYADNVEKQVMSALEKINVLSESILAKAFRGELTEQWRKENLALISGENSAETLLVKIKNEKNMINKLPKDRAVNLKKKDNYE